MLVVGAVVLLVLACASVLLAALAHGTTHDVWRLDEPVRSASVAGRAV